MPTLDVNNRQLHYLDIGAGEPLLFGHSYLWDHRMWEAQVEALSPYYRCIVPDLWGHGRSQPLDRGDYSIIELAEDHWRLMQGLGIDNFSIVGLSVGGMWAAELAIKYPAAVKSLVLMDTYLGAEPEQSRALYLDMLDQVERSRSIPGPMIEQLIRIFLSPATLKANPRLAEEFRQGLACITPAQIPTLVTLGRAIFRRLDRLDALDTVHVPTLVMVGEHDRPRPVSEAVAMAKRLPNAQFDIIADAGHIAAREQPEAVNQRLEYFLRPEKSRYPAVPDVC